MFKLKRIDYGIHTIQLNLNNLKYSQVDKVNTRIAKLEDLIPLSNNDDYISRTYLCRDFEEYGVSSIITRQTANKSNSVSFVVNPSSLVTKKIHPVMLFQPSEDDCDKIVNRVMSVTKSVHLQDLHDSTISSDRLSLGQVDVTANLWFDQDTQLEPLLRLFRKADVPNGFTRNKEQAGFCINSGNVTIKAYDKLRELEDRGHLPKKLKNEVLLRVEISMKRGKFLKVLELDKDASLCEMLDTACRKAPKLINDYLEKLFPASAGHLRYDDAKQTIIDQVKKKKMRDQMLFLLDKTSDSDGLNRAIDLLNSKRAKDGKKPLQSVELSRIFKKFDDIGVNPITLPNKSTTDCIPNIRHMLASYESANHKRKATRKQSKQPKFKGNYKPSSSFLFPPVVIKGLPAFGSAQTDDNRDSDGFYVLRWKDGQPRKFSFQR